MNEMIERVARALARESGVNPDEECGSEAHPASPAWRNWVQDARTAIKAMREPTERMTHVGVDAVPALWLDARYVTEIAAKSERGMEPEMADVWRSMIDAILEDGE